MSAGFPRPYGRYVLEERLAMGGMAEIFRARTATQGFEKRVCIKRILPHFLEDEEFVTMFRDEARTAAKLQHANVVQVFDFGEEEGSLYLAMELVDGVDLRRVLETARKRKLALEVGEVVQIGIDVCRGLHHAHKLAEGGRTLGIVHRDISPHNILVSRAGEVKITDFGIAKAAERSTHTGTGIVKGKVAYMAPEQAEGLGFDHRLDQFAVGVVMWELLTGARLFVADGEAATLRKVLACEVPPPSSVRSDVPGALDEVVQRALAKSPADRFADMRAFELALSRFLYSGAIDPATADVRNLYARVMDGAENLRKTKVANADDVRRQMEQADQEALRAAGDLPPQSATQTQSDPARVLASSTDHDPKAPVSSDVSRVFSSNDKVAAAPRPGSTGRAVALAGSEEGSGAGPPSNPLAQALRQSGAQPAAPNVPTLLEDDPRAVARATSGPPPERSIFTKSASDVSLSQAAAEAGAPAPAAVVDDGTPATRTHIPRAAEPWQPSPAPAGITSTENLPGRPRDRAARNRRAAMLGVFAGVACVAALAVVFGMKREAPQQPSAQPVTAPAPAPVPLPGPKPTAAALVAPTPAPPPATAGAADAGPMTRDPEVPSAAAAARPPPAKRATGTLLLQFHGSLGWGNVSVDGKPKGELTDLAALPLVVGKHRVTIENPGAKVRKVFDVEVVADKRRVYDAATGHYLGVK